MEATIEAGRERFTQLLRAELTKFRTVRAWMIALCAAAAAAVILSFLSAFASRATMPAVPIGPGGEAVSDTYMYVHQALAGDGALTVRVASLSGTHTSDSGNSGSAFGVSSRGGQAGPQHPGMVPWAKAGIILEPDTRPGTDYAAVMLTGAHGVQLQYDYTRSRPGLAGSAGPASPRWLRLTRAGDIITGYDSADGATWHKIGRVRLAGLPRAVQVGLFVSSPAYFAPGATQGSPSTATATFDQLSVRGDLPRGAWTGQPVAGFYPSGLGASTWQRPAPGMFRISGSGDIAPLVGGTHWSGASIVNGTIAGLLVVIVLAALFVTTEYRRRLIRVTLSAWPRRGQVLAAKAVIAGSLAFIAGVVATGIAEAITRHVFAANGNYLFPQGGLATARVIIGTGLFLGLGAALVVALGTMLRRGAWTVLAGLALLVLPGVLATSLPAGADRWLMKVTPTAAFAIQATLPRSGLVTDAYIPASGYFPISSWAGLAVLAAYTAVALGAAAWVLRRRDA